MFLIMSWLIFAYKRVHTFFPKTVDTLVVPYSLNIKGCIFDTIRVGVPIGNVVYQLSNGPIQRIGDFVNAFAADCPFANEYSLE